MGGIDFSAERVSFSHPALGDPDTVTVRQDTSRESSICVGRDPTAPLVWPGVRTTCEWLCGPGRSEGWIEGKRVVEIGAGTGLLGLVAARLGASSVTMTDLPDELPLLRQNLAANDVSGRCGEVSVKPCTWGNEEHISALGTFDVVLCCDVLYTTDEDTQLALARTMRALCAPNGRVLFSYYFRENVLNHITFFGEVDELFEDPVKHSLYAEGEEEEGDEEEGRVWLNEYRLPPPSMNGVSVH